MSNQPKVQNSFEAELKELQERIPEIVEDTTVEVYKWKLTGDLVVNQNKIYWKLRLHSNYETLIHIDMNLIRELDKEFQFYQVETLQRGWLELRFTTTIKNP